MQRVVGALKAAFGDDQVAIQVAAGTQQGVTQTILFQMHGAGRRDQNPVLVQQPHGLLVEASVRSFAVADILALLDKGRRIGNDHVEALAGAFQLLQCRHHIALDHQHLFGDAIELCVGFHPVQRRR